MTESHSLELDENDAAAFKAALGYSLLGALFCLLAWWLCGTGLAALCGWICALCFSASVLKGKPCLRAFYVAGCLINVGGFYWLFNTISTFGEFHWLATLLIFTLFVALSALQFPLVALLFKHLPARLDDYSLRLPLAWVSAEFLWIRIFPWQLAHTQLGFTPFAQCADLFGTLFISFMLLWCAESLVRIFVLGQRRGTLTIPLLLFCALLLYGFERAHKFAHPAGETQALAVIQGNIPASFQYDPANNLSVYTDLTSAVQADNLLVIWPETSIPEWIYGRIGSVSRDPRIPRFEKKIHLLAGALSFLSRSQLYNSALAVYADGTIPEPYNKQILMPFGEYTPFDSWLPWLKNLNSTVSDFTAGSEVRVFHYPAQKADGTQYTIDLAPLICYEDVVPTLARQATLAGAQLLVNLTNDAWFGDSLAASHHNIIASFRAIENRRYLVRATNTGLSSVINPLGQTVYQLNPRQRATLLASVTLLGYKSLYTRVFGEGLWWLVSIATVLVALIGFGSRKKGEQS